MASSDSEHSIAGISIPQWMKNKINDRYDLDQNTFSPPTEDDSFFYIRYPKTESASKHLENDNNNSSSYRAITDVLENHTLPCQEFIPAAKVTPRELGLKQGKLDPPLGVAKSSGTDDGFHGLGAACGHSVVAVAHQMVTGGRGWLRSAGSGTGTDSEDESNPGTPPNLSRRRGSRSLPSSPQRSPKSLRKNPYFTNGILGSSDNIIEEGKETRHGWLLSFMKDSNSLQGSMSELKISDEASHIPVASEPIIVKPKLKVARPRPSQLREMNFWSPTSM